MGKDSPEQTTSYDRQPLLGDESWYVRNALDFWNAIMSGEGGATTPWEQWGTETYGQALQSLFGQGEAPGGLFGAGQEALQYYLSPEYRDVMGDPAFQQTLEQIRAREAHKAGQLGLQYGSSLPQMITRASAPFVLDEQARRAGLQSQLGMFAEQFPLQGIGQFMQMAGLPLERQYQAAQMLGNLGLGSAGQPMPTTTTMDEGKGWLPEMLMTGLSLYTGINPGWLPGIGAAAGGGGGFGLPMGNAPWDFGMWG